MQRQPRVTRRLRALPAVLSPLHNYPQILLARLFYARPLLIGRFS